MSDHAPILTQTKGSDHHSSQPIRRRKRRVVAGRIPSAESTDQT